MKLINGSKETDELVTIGTVTSIGWLLDKISDLKWWQGYKRHKLLQRLLKLRTVYLINSMYADKDRLIFETKDLKVYLNREQKLIRVNDVAVSFEFLKIISDNTLMYSTSFMFCKDPTTGALLIVPNYTIVSNN